MFDLWFYTFLSYVEILWVLVQFDLRIYIQYNFFMLSLSTSSKFLRLAYTVPFFLTMSLLGCLAWEWSIQTHPTTFIRIWTQNLVDHLQVLTHAGYLHHFSYLYVPWLYLLLCERDIHLLLINIIFKSLLKRNTV